MLNQLEIHGNHQVGKNCISKLRSAFEKIDRLDELIDEEKEVNCNNNNNEVVENDHDDEKVKYYGKKEGKVGKERKKGKEEKKGKEGK